MFLFRCTHPDVDTFLFIVLAPDAALARVRAAKRWNGDGETPAVSSRDVVADKVLSDSSPVLYMVDDEFNSIRRIETVE